MEPEVATTPRVSSDLVAVSVQDLSITFRVYSERKLSLREIASRGFRSRESQKVEAVKQASLDIRVGEAVGIVGFNGSGKSTLLAAIAGLLVPEHGRVLVRHQPVLLGVGAALKGELSGYRNIELGGLAMGMSISQIRSLQEQVGDFTELGEALNRPLSTYSSGMKARLSFAVATLQQPEILLIDEALAVGDKHFRAKSLDRIRAIQQAAGTIIMVTHNLDEVRKTCTRAIWMHNGEIMEDGDVDDVLASYGRAEQ